MIGAWRLPATFGVMIAVGLVIGAAEADDHGFFGEITAAWVQAVGSVAAIVVSAAIAIWIDQGAARRLRSDRDAQATRSTRDKVITAAHICRQAGVRAGHCADMTLTRVPELLRLFPTMSNEFARYERRLEGLPFDAQITEKARALIMDAEVRLTALRGFIDIAGVDLHIDTAAKEDTLAKLRKSIAHAGRDMTRIAGELASEAETI